MTVDAPLIASSTTVLASRVRLLHASTSAPLGPLAGRLRPDPPGWTVRGTDGALLVLRRAEVVRPAPATPPRLAATLLSGRWRQLLDIPPLPDEPPGTVLVDLDAEEVDVRLDPVAMTLVVTLTTPSTGAPRTGRTVTAHGLGGSGAPRVDLHEGAAGVYASAPTRWGRALTPCELRVGGSPLRTVSMSFTSTATRVRLVDTT